MSQAFSRLRRLTPASVVGGLLAVALTATVSPVAPTQAAVGILPETVSADLLPTVQTNGIVYSLAVVGNTVYAGGFFSSARPAGAPAGTQESPRANILAFDLTTGALLPFHHTISAPAFTSATDPGPFCQGTGVLHQWVCADVFRVVPSPDGTRIYVAGDFTRVDGQARYRVAAFRTSDGALDTTFKPTVSSRVRGLAVTNSTVYLAGNFTSVNSVARTRVAAVDTKGALVTAFAPTADREVWAAELSSDGTRLLLGGQFDKVDGVALHGIAYVYTAKGTLAPWASTTIIPGAPGATTNRSWVTDFAVRGQTVYVSVDGEGPEIFDGRFSANVSTGKTNWIDYCLGATQAITELNGVVYSANHAHDCSKTYAWPERTPRYYNRVVAETATVNGANDDGTPIPALIPLFDSTDGGPATSYWRNGPWAIESSSSGYVVLGGEFLTVNNLAQQGLARFVLRSKSPHHAGPLTPFPAPAVRSLAAGSARVSWQATWDRDDSSLTYQVFRDSGNTPVATVSRSSSFYNQPQLSFTDTGLVPGSVHTYRVRAIDPDGNYIGSPVSAPVTVAAASVLGSYVDHVIADGASNLITFDDPVGAATAADVLGTNPALLTGVTLGTPGAFLGSGTAATFAGTSTSFAALKQPMFGPNTYSVEAWFRTTSTTGAKIVGLGNHVDSPSTNYDRQIYLTDTGRIVFGVYNHAGEHTLTTGAGYADGRWHQVVSTLGPTGMALYLDGVLTTSDPTTTQAEYAEGYWRIGGDSTGGWPLPPTSGGFLTGAVDEVSVYPVTLTAAQVADHYAMAQVATVPAGTGVTPTNG